MDLLKSFFYARSDEVNRMPKQNNLVGNRYGFLTVLEKTPSIKGGNVVWLCECECGKNTTVTSYNLTSGRVRSCGCFRTKLTSERNIERSTTHGLRYTKIYAVWNVMKQRCNNPSDNSYMYYGGRGINVCEEWSKDFMAFYQHVSKLPHFDENGYTLDRIDNNGNYEPGNVRWATRKEQRANQRPRKKQVILNH